MSYVKDLNKNEDLTFSDVVEKIKFEYLGNKVPLTQLYPEYDFCSPYGVWTGNVSIYAALPFYKQLIIHLDPVREKKDFRKIYGITFEEMTHFFKDSRLILLLRTNYENYPRYYKELFEIMHKNKHIPLNNRYERFYLSHSGENMDLYYKKIQNKFPNNRYPIPFKLKNDSLKKIKSSQIRKFIYNLMAQRMIKLKIVGLNKESIDIIEHNGFLEAYNNLHRYNRAFACPMMDALGGWDNLDEAHIDILKFGKTINKKGEQIIVPKDLLFWLNQQINYKFPTDLTSRTKYLEIMEDKYNIEENHKLLISLQKYFNEPDIFSSDSITNKSKILIQDFELKIEEIKKTEKTFKKWVNRPLRYGCLVTSAIAFALMAEFWVKDGNINGIIGSGLVGTGTTVLSEIIDDIEKMLISLRYGKNTIPTIIWDRYR